jgi:hypothetical protein
VAAVEAAWCSGLRWGVEAAASRMPSLTPAFCVVLVHRLHVCYMWHRMQYSRVLPSRIPAGIPDSVGFRNKLILPWNDLIPTCDPGNRKKSVEFGGFWKMRPVRNRRWRQSPIVNDATIVTSATEQIMGTHSAMRRDITISERAGKSQFPVQNLGEDALQHVTWR